MTPRLIFAGTPEFAAASLDALIKANYDIIAVFTQPDRPAGRGRKLTPSPVKQIALAHQLPVYQPEKLDEQSYEQIQTLSPDLVIVAAYGLLIPKRFLPIPRLGFINVHASLLPRWRGASPIQHAILEGDNETGITLMQMDAGLDTGPMLLKQACPIKPHDTAQDLHDRLAKLGAETLCLGLTKLFNGELEPEDQDDRLATYAKKISKSQAQIDWQQSAQTIERQIRAFNPWPICYTHFQNAHGEWIVLRIWQAEVILKDHENTPGEIRDISQHGIDVACGKNILRLTQIQLPGKRILSTNDIANAMKDHLQLGQQFLNQ